MKLSQTSDKLLLPRNENIELAPLLAPTLAKIWAEFPGLTPWTKDEAGLLQPLYPDFARLENIVVLGLNPSCNAKHRDSYSYPAKKFDGPYFRRMADFMGRAAGKYQELFQSPQESLKSLYYFGGLEWSHLDLLYMRATSQKDLKKQLWATPEAAEFTWEQLQLTKKLLAQLAPTMLIVANRVGQTLTGFDRKFNKSKNVEENEWMGLQFEPTLDKFGAYRIIGSTTAGTPDTEQISRLVGTPVFFTGSFASTNRRSTEADDKLLERIAAAYLPEGDRYFEQWHLR